MVADMGKAGKAAAKAGWEATGGAPGWFSRPGPRFRPAAYWFWHSLPSTEEMRAQLADFKDKGYGTILIQARLAMPRHVYLSKAFLACYGQAAAIMAELGLAGGIYDDYNWTSGQAAGRTVEGADHLRERHLFWAGGADATGGIRGIRAAFAEGMGADIADWLYERGRAVFADWRLVAACRHPAEIHSLSDVVDVTAEVSIHGGEGACDYSYRGTLAEGEQLTVFISARCVTSRLINYLMPEAGERFVTVGLEPIGRALSAFDRHAMDFLFFDQPAPGFYDWQARQGALGNSLLFTPEFGRELAGATGQPLGSVLLALAREVGNDTARLRCGAFETYTKRIYGAFFAPLREFCRRHGLRFTGHEILPHVGSFALNGGFSSIDPRVVPAVDFFGLDALRDETAVDANNFEPQLSVKLGDSVARAHGRSRAMVEIYTTALRTEKRGAGQWELAPATLRAQSIRFHMQGARQVIFHALNQTAGEAGDHRLFVNPRFDFAPALNFEPWWAHHGAMAAETARLSAFLEDMVPETPVAVFYPLHTAWAEGPRHAHAKHFGAWCEALDRMSCGHMIVDERSIASAVIEDGAMRMNGLEFRALVLPSVTLIAEPEVFKRIVAFQASGGRVWVTGDVPRLLGNFERILPVERISDAAPTMDMIRTLCGSLAPLNVTITGSDKVMRASGRDGEGATRIVLFNDGGQEEDVGIETASAFGWELYDCANGAVAPREASRRLELRLAPHELRCLRLHPASGEADVFRENRPQPHRSIVLDSGWTFQGPDDIVRPIAVTQGWERQGFERFSGTSIYRRSLAIDTDAHAVLELPGLAVAAVARLDGRPVGATAHPPFRIDLGRLAAGAHLLELHVSNTAANEYYADTPFAGEAWPDRSGLTAAPELHLFESGKD